MRITLERFHFTKECTIGKLLVDGLDSGIFTLEDAVRDIKIDGQTAIPPGVYSVAITYSPRFDKDMPQLIGVPGFSGVRIHPGNTDKDTEGCILVGKSWYGHSYIGRSKEAFKDLFNRINRAPFVEIEVK